MDFKFGIGDATVGRARLFDMELAIGKFAVRRHSCPDSSPYKTKLIPGLPLRKASNCGANFSGLSSGKPVAANCSSDRATGAARCT